jgi:endonuclease YncB( thermonuclease family)
MSAPGLLLIGLVSVTVAAALWRHAEAAGPVIAGHAVVMDGDSLRIGDDAIRLAGIDAPELGQSCTGPGNVGWACGLEAKRQLAERIGDKPVSCRQIKIDLYDRIVAICTTANGDDLSAAMARSGYALPDGSDPRYKAEETFARSAGAGMWSGSFQIPWEWRMHELERQDGCC